MAQGHLILLPGMNADVHLFDGQRRAFSHLVVPAWIRPRERESIATYAVRLATTLTCNDPCFVGGASFGGIVALEMAAHLRAHACFLIASIRSPNALPWWANAARPLSVLNPSVLGALARMAGTYSSSSMSARTARRLRKLDEPSSEFERWASWALLRWWPSPAVKRVRVFQIHGSEDRTLPAHCSQAEVMVRGAGHLLPVTHANEVNAFLKEGMMRAG